jgi:ribosomal protein S18 acetylase RimI-like enzyme
MNTALRKAVLPNEIRSLLIFDHKVFAQWPSDWFQHDDWWRYETWWLIVDGIKVGCCAFELHTDFDEASEFSVRPRAGSLYIATTGILPRFRRKGLGDLMKRWQISYALHHGFSRIVTNTRKSNTPMIALNKKHGFTVIRTSAAYYRSPAEPVAVMELQLAKPARAITAK